MPSAYWYYGLVVVSIVMLALALHRNRDLKLVVLHLVLAGVIHPFEIMVMLILVGYCYLPGILPQYGHDNAAGAVISDLFIVPASAAIINAFSMGWGAIAGFAAAFTVIDWYYDKIGVYKHFWWKSAYTGVCLLLFYAVSRKVWNRLKKSNADLWFRLMVIYMVYSPLHATVNFFTVMVFNLYRFQIPWVEGPARDHGASHTPFLYLAAVLVSLGTGLTLKFRYRLAVFGLLMLMNWALGHYQVFVPEIITSSSYLNAIPIVVVAFMVVLFWAAKLDYLFP